MTCFDDHHLAAGSPGDQPPTFLRAIDDLVDAAAELHDELDAYVHGPSAAAVLVAAGRLAVAASDLMAMDSANIPVGDRATAHRLLYNGGIHLHDVVELLAHPVARGVAVKASGTVKAASALVQRLEARREAA